MTFTQDIKNIILSEGEGRRNLVKLLPGHKFDLWEQPLVEMQGKVRTIDPRGLALFTCA